MSMFLVELNVTLRGSHRPTDDEITDLIETVVDELDQQAIDPSVGTSRVGDDVAVTLSLAIDEAEEFEALARGVAAARVALAAAGVGAGTIEPHALSSRVLPVLAA